MSISYQIIASPVGELIVGATESQLCLLEYYRPERWEAMKKKFQKWYLEPLMEGRNAIIDRTKAQLTEYFSGVRKIFELPLDVRGTDFEQRVWAQLLRIPFGQLWSYGDIARKLKIAQSARAVGTANHNNHIAIIIPCHRVVGANGQLTGYGGGLDKKDFLIGLERGQRLL